MSAETIKRGDRWRFRHPDAPGSPVFIEVTRVARDGSWADIVCVTLASEWRKRQQLPMPEHTEPYAWTVDDLEAEYDRERQRMAPEVRVIEVPVPDMTVTEAGPNSYRVVIGGGEPGVG